MQSACCVMMVGRVFQVNGKPTPSQLITWETRQQGHCAEGEHHSPPQLRKPHHFLGQEKGLKSISIRESPRSARNPNEPRDKSLRWPRWPWTQRRSGRPDGRLQRLEATGEQSIKPAISQNETQNDENLPQVEGVQSNGRRYHNQSRHYWRFSQDEGELSPGFAIWG